MHSPNKELRSRPQVDERGLFVGIRCLMFFEVGLLACISCPPNTLGYFSEYFILKKIGKIMKGGSEKINPQELRQARVTGKT